MKYAERLKEFVEKPGVLQGPCPESPYYHFVVYSVPNERTNFSIIEVGDDFVVIQDYDDGRKLSLPIDLLVLIS